MLVQSMPSASHVQRTELVKKLFDEGFMSKSKRGRPSIYQTDEDRMAALRAQRKACSLRYTERLRAAMNLLKVSAEQERSSIPRSHRDLQGVAGSARPIRPH